MHSRQCPAAASPNGPATHRRRKTISHERVRERIKTYLIKSVRRRAVAQYIGLLAGRARIEGFALPATASPLVQ